MADWHESRRVGAIEVHPPTADGHGLARRFGVGSFFRGPSMSDIEVRIAMQSNAIIGQAMQFAAVWQWRNGNYIPPLFRLPGVELPIVPRVELPRVDGRKDVER